MGQREHYAFMKQIILTIFNIYTRIAQSVEHLTVNQRVVGSSPTVGAISQLTYK